MEILTFKQFKEGKGFWGDRDDIVNELNLPDTDLIVSFAYTDYGGDFFDKVCVEYFSDKNGNFVYQQTPWHGKNMILYGDIAKDFIKKSENYMLRYEDIESFYFEKQFEAERESFEYFVNDVYKDYEYKEKIVEYLLENYSGYFTILPSGEVDYSTEKLVKSVDNYLENALPLELSKEREKKIDKQYFEKI